jgi:hypothetical protein
MNQKNFAIEHQKLEFYKKSSKSINLKLVSFLITDSSLTTTTIKKKKIYHNSPSVSLAGTSIILGLSIILAVLFPFSTIPIIQA